ncbi:uncharacterized protein VTP21DRAFT_9949 [Calcarisporiella thermophila]|uniref:uncharacterized protein n=1 Tax=Calcarisporiella thermophila TaxID=911321 RepID=UPI0037445254
MARFIYTAFLMTVLSMVVFAAPVPSKENVDKRAFCYNPSPACHGWGETLKEANVEEYPPSSRYKESIIGIVK